VALTDIRSVRVITLTDIPSVRAIQHPVDPNERRAVNRQPVFRSGDTYRRNCVFKDFFYFAANPVDMGSLFCDPTYRASSTYLTKA
jgi:hypothetical protein